MKANMIANMQVAMVGTNKKNCVKKNLNKKNALRAKQKFKKNCRASREGLIGL